MTELASKARLHNRTIYNLFAGKRLANPNTVKKLASALRVDPSELTANP